MIANLGSWAYDKQIDALYYTVNYNNKTVMVTYGPTKYYGEINIPDHVLIEGERYNVIGIGKRAFWFCEKLETISLPNSISIINEEAFSHCIMLQDVIIPNSVQSVDWGAFHGCSSLTSIKISESIKEIPEEFLGSCEQLINIYIPSSVEKIGPYAFNCRNLNEVTIAAPNVPLTNNYAFGQLNLGNMTLRVPSSSMEDYKTSTPWNQFGCIKSIEENTSNTEKCAKPTIQYKYGKLFCISVTPEAEVISEIRNVDAKKYFDNIISLSATYDITAYATKSGYDNSDIATATLVWATATFTSEDATNAKEITVDALPLLITQNDGVLTVSGLQDGETITAYSTDGKQIARSKAIGNAVLLNLSELQGKVAVLNVGGKSTKVMVK